MDKKSAELGIDIWDPQFGVLLPTRKVSGIAANPVVHRGMHTQEYLRNIESGLLKAENREEAISFLAKIKKELLSGARTLNSAE